MGAGAGFVRALLAAGALAVAFATLAAAPKFHFTQQPGGGPPISAALLSESERAFIAGLPVVRVGVARPGTLPYEQIDANGEVSGIHPDMLMALASAFGIRITPVVFADWPSTLKAARDQQVDLLMSVGVSNERLEFLAFTIGATPSPAALFSRRGATAVDVSQARFALERDYLANDYVRRQYPDARIVTVANTGDALRAVAAGKADYYLGSLLAASSLLTRDPVPGVEALRLLNYATGHYHFGVRKDWPQLVAILNKGIQTLRANPSGPLANALAGLPVQLRPKPALSLPAEDAAVLVHRPVWRIGAVRGLTMLNDFSEQQVHSGIGAEYAEQVTRRLGVAMQVLPFDNVAAMLDALRDGAIDLVPFLTKTPARDREFRYSDAYFEMPYLLVARSDGPLYWGLESLRGRRLALARDHPLREVLRERFPQVQVVDAAHGSEAMDMVARGNADAAVEVKLFANLRINGDNDGQLRATASVDELPAQFHFAASAQSAQLIPLVNRALADVPPDERERMLRRWVALDLQPGFPWRRHLPLIALACASLLLLAGLTTWWMRRLSLEVLQRRRSEILLNDIATTMPGVAFRYVLEKDGSLRHHFFSPSAEAFLGLKLDPHRTVLASVTERLPPHDQASVRAAQELSLQSKQPFKFTSAYNHPDGRRRWLHAEAVHTLAPKGRSVWTGYIVDVTPERELQERLAHEAQARNLLLATASHELRAPTHNLSLALQSIDHHGLDAQQTSALRIASKSAQTLTQLLNDVLDAAHFDSGAMQLRPVSFALPELLADLRETWLASAGAKGLALNVECADDVPERLVQDPLRLKQVLTNLLSNAFKYTQHGEVALRVRRDGERLCFVVSDTGCGLDAQAQARLFKPFVTLDSAGTPAAREGSSGLGLVICRRIAELMGGSIELRSNLDVGSEFSLRVPLEAPRTAVVLPAAAATGQIIVCDDDPTSRMLTAQMLRLRGYRVSEAGDGVAALAAWREGHVSALVTDLDMPGMPGRELIRALRDAEIGGAHRTAVVVCSGSPVPARSPHEEALLHDAYLLKPVQLDTLVSTLRELGVRA